jgi:hypothetical protein
MRLSHDTLVADHGREESVRRNVDKTVHSFAPLHDILCKVCEPRLLIQNGRSNQYALLVTMSQRRSQTAPIGAVSALTTHCFPVLPVVGLSFAASIS